MGTVTVYRTRFIEPDEPDGWAGPEYNEDTTDTEVIEVDGIREAIEAIKRAGCTFSAIGSGWAADPDGSYTSNYATGERVETSAHLSGFSEEVLIAIERGVG